MKTKYILIGIFTFLVFSTYAQTEKNAITEIKGAVTELKVETENLNELKNFDWNKVKEIFRENNGNQNITLVFAYINKSEIDKPKLRIDNFKIELTGKTADLDKLTAILKNSFEKFSELDGKNKS